MERSFWLFLAVATALAAWAGSRRSPREDERRTYVPMPRIDAPSVPPPRDFVTLRPQWVTPPAGQEFDPFFSAAEMLYSLPPGLLSRVAWQESRYDPDAVSPAGAVGLMQINPRWHPDVDPTDPIASIYYAAGYLRENFERFGSWDKALAAYNWGPTILSRTIAREGDEWLASAPRETREYVRDISADVRIA